MANFLEQKERRVIPNWRNFIATVKSEELKYSYIINKVKVSNALSIKGYIDTWKFDKSISVAGDLISAAYVNNLLTDNEVNEAAKFIISNVKNSAKPAIDLAHIILQDKTDYATTEEFVQSFDDLLPIQYYRKLIAKYRELINNYPYNPILYVDIARIYSIIGIKDKAIKNILIALDLAKNNRFVLRAASRLFSHFDEVEWIHRIFKNSDIINNDPWIISTEIALSSLLKKSSKYIKTGFKILESDNYNNSSLSELSSSLGTIELLNGSFRKARKLFRKSLMSPNDNSLAQIEWINSNYKLVDDIDPSSYGVLNNYEAMALNKYTNGEYEDAFKYSIDWFLDLPFSMRSVKFGGYIANSFLNDTSSAIRIYKAGLSAHAGNPEIINGLAYAFAIENKCDEAETYFRQIDNSIEKTNSTLICLTATWGLILFRRGNIPDGKIFYEDAIKKAESINNDQLIWLAKLNYVRELILSKSSPLEKISKLLDVPDNTIYENINRMKKEIIDLFEKNKYQLKS